MFENYSLNLDTWFSEFLDTVRMKRVGLRKLNYTKVIKTLAQYLLDLVVLYYCWKVVNIIQNWPRSNAMKHGQNWSKVIQIGQHWRERVKVNENWSNSMKIGQHWWKLVKHFINSFVECCPIVMVFGIWSMVSTRVHIYVGNGIRDWWSAQWPASH
jgi:hypothetical protein